LAKTPGRPLSTFGATMLFNAKSEGRRVINLIKSVREIGFILPGDKVIMVDEAQATYLGSIEEGDIQVDYLQMHAFRLHDGLRVFLEAPALNRSLGKSLY
jgi:hypothetical protein